MGRVWIGLAVLAFSLSACDAGEVEGLEDRLRAARSEAASATREAADLRTKLKATRRELEAVEENLAELDDAGRPGRGLVVALPLIGSLRWDCNDAREFSFTFTPDAADIVVQHSVDGEVTKKRLRPGDELVGPYVAVDAHQEWTVTYRHKPGIVSAGIYVEPAVDEGACVIDTVSVEENRA
jgi:hypothetical protein